MLSGLWPWNWKEPKAPGWRVWSTAPLLKHPWSLCLSGQETELSQQLVPKARGGVDELHQELKTVANLITFCSKCRFLWPAFSAKHRATCIFYKNIPKLYSPLHMLCPSREDETTNRWQVLVMEAAQQWWWWGWYKDLFRLDFSVALLWNQMPPPLIFLPYTQCFSYWEKGLAGEKRDRKRRSPKSPKSPTKPKHTGSQNLKWHFKSK